MKKNSLLILLMFLFELLFSQDISNTNIKVTDGYVPIVPQANRLNENALLVDTIREDRKQVYSIKNFNINSDFLVKPIKPAVVGADMIPKLYRYRLLLASGYGISTQTSFLFNSLRSNIYAYSVELNQQSKKINIDNKEAGSNLFKISAFGKFINEDLCYSGNFEYDRYGVFTYATSGTNNSSYKDNPYYNQFSFTNFSLSLNSTDSDSKKLKHKSTLSFSDLNEGVENELSITSNLFKKINDIDLSLLFKLDKYSNYDNKLFNATSGFNDTTYIGIGRLRFVISPIVNVQKFGFNFNFGLNFTSEKEDNIPLAKLDAGLSPYFYVSNEIVDNLIFLKLGLENQQFRNTIRHNYLNNPYIHTYGMNRDVLGEAFDVFRHDIRITEESKIYFLVHNTLSNNHFLKLNLSYSFIDNFSEFILSENSFYGRFITNYKKLRKFSVESNYSISFNTVYSFDANIRYSLFSKEVYHHPAIDFEIQLPINLADKIYISPNFNYVGKRIARKDVYVNGNISSKEILDLEPIFSTNISLHYTYNSKLSIYINLNNITNSKREYWLGYKHYGFNGILGASFSF